MNYSTTNQDILRAIETIFNTKFPQNSKVNFAVSYSQHRKLSMVIVQVDGANFYHALILVYNKGLSLYDVVKYNKSVVRRYGILSKLTPPVTLIKNYVSKYIPSNNPLTSRKLKEENAADNEDLKIDNLKNQIEQLKNKNRSYRDEIQNLKDRIALLNKKHKRNI
jgi:type II secretory pathway component GspD/PulD (secretin)